MVQYQENYRLLFILQFGGAWVFKACPSVRLRSPWLSRPVPFISPSANVDEALPVSDLSPRSNSWFHQVTVLLSVPMFLISASRLMSSLSLFHLGLIPFCSRAFGHSADVLVHTLANSFYVGS